MSERKEYGLYISAKRLLEVRPQLDGALPLCVDGIEPCVAENVQNYLLRFYNGDILAAITIDGECSKSLKLRELSKESARVFCGRGFGLRIEGEAGFDKKVYTFGDLMRIMERLTAPDGCPWDIAQTHQSIRENMLEEAGEAAAAIDSGDTDNLIEELGDVMLQSIFHADIARRSGGFEMSDIITRLCRKLFTRHTHVFGENKATSAEDALESWQQAKAREKAERGD